MGLYQLILALYTVFVSFATAGIHVPRRVWQPKVWPAAADGADAARAMRHGAGLWHGGHGCAGRAGRPLRGICCMTSVPRLRLLILAPSLPFMAVSGGGAGVLFGGAAGAAQHHSAAC